MILVAAASAAGSLFAVAVVAALLFHLPWGVDIAKLVGHGMTFLSPAK